MTAGRDGPQIDPLLLWSVAQTTRDAVVSMDAAGTLTFWNAAAEELLGWPAAEVLGRPMAEVLVPPELRAAHRAGVHRYAVTGVARVAGHPIALSALHREGHRIAVHLTIWPTDGPQGPAFHAFLSAESDLAHEQARLEHSRAQYRRLAFSAPGASFSHRIGPTGAGRTEFVTGGSDLLLGRAAEDTPDLEQLVHPEDRADFGIALDVSRAELSPLTWQGRLAPDGHLERAVLVTATPVATDDGTTQWDGLVLDVTAEQAAQRAIVEQARRSELLELALAAMADAGTGSVVVCDDAGTVLAATPDARDAHPAGSVVDLDRVRSEPLRNLGGEVVGLVARLA